MIRHGGRLASIGRRELSSSAQHKFLSRIRPWPFVKREEPVSYRLQIVRPRFHGAKSFARRTVRFLIVTSIIYYLLPVSVEVSVEDDEKEAMTDTGGIELEENDEDEEEPGLFIPLTWPVELERTFYQGSDPEWQDYMKFAKDKESQKRAHQAVVMLCRQAFIDIPELARSIGTVNVEKGKYWLDVDFPLGPPPDYEQIGIEFGSSFVALAAQTMSQEDYIQLCRYFDPKAVLMATQTAGSSVMLFVKNFVSKKLLSRDTTTSGPNEEEGHQAELQASHRPIGPIGTMGPIAAPSSKGKPKAHDSPTESRPSEGEGQVDQSDHPHPPEGSKHNPEHVQQLMRRFFAQPFSQPMDASPPRGSVVLGGLVECHGTNFIATVDVVAAWDLNEEQIVMHNAKVRHVTPRRIAPHPTTRMASYGSRRPPQGPVGPGGAPPTI